MKDRRVTLLLTASKFEGQLSEVLLSPSSRRLCAASFLRFTPRSPSPNPAAPRLHACILAEVPASHPPPQRPGERYRAHDTTFSCVSCARFISFKGWEIAPNLGTITGALLTSRQLCCKIQTRFIWNGAGGYCGFHAVRLQDCGSALFQTQQKQHPSPSPTQTRLHNFCWNFFFFLVHPEVKTHNGMENFSSNKFKMWQNCKLMGTVSELGGAGQV